LFFFFASWQAALFKAPNAGTEDAEGYVAQADIDKLMQTSRFKPDRDFAGVDRSAPRSARNEPVQFDRGTVLGAPTQPEPQQQQQAPPPRKESDDLLAGLDDFLASAKSTQPTKKSKK
jgi:hypothetical protein